jgi:hypothetical protein
MDVAKPNRNKRGRSSEPSIEGPKHLAGWLLGLALLLAVVSYWPALKYGFVYDDTEQIVTNPSLRSWTYLPQYFTANVWEGVHPGGGGSYYRPLFLLWLRLNYVLFKLAPWGWHLTSLLAHLAVVAVLFFLARRWSKDGVVAGWAALLFALHPIHIEAVAWVSAVPEVLYTLAGLGAVYFYLRFRQERHRAYMVAAVVLYGVALIAKETAIVIWPMIAACDWWLDRESHHGDPPVAWLATMRRQIPFAAVTAGYIGLRVHALRGLGGGITVYTVAELLRIAPSLLWLYLQKLVLPYGLSLIYPDSREGFIAGSQFYLPLIAVCLVGIGLLLWCWKSRAAAFPGTLLALSLLPPLLGVLFFPRHDLAHDRYMYLPSVGVCTLLALALRKATRDRKSFAGPRVRWIAHLMAVCVSLILVFAVRAQVPPYHDDRALFTRAVQISPDSAVAWGLLGEQLMTERHYPEGIAAFQRAQILAPDEYLPNYRLGAANYFLQNMPSAEIFYQRAANCYGKQEIISYDYTLFQLGLSQYAQGKMNEANTTLRRAIDFNPKMPGYHLALGAAMKYQGELREAEKQLELALELGADQEASEMLREVDAELKSKPMR